MFPQLRQDDAFGWAGGSPRAMVVGDGLVSQLLDEGGKRPATVGSPGAAERKRRSNKRATTARTPYK